MVIFFLNRLHGFLLDPERKLLQVFKLTLRHHSFKGCLLLRLNRHSLLLGFCYWLFVEIFRLRLFMER